MRNLFLAATAAAYALIATLPPTTAQARIATLSCNVKVYDEKGAMVQAVDVQLKVDFTRRTVDGYQAIINSQAITWKGSHPAGGNLSGSFNRKTGDFRSSNLTPDGQLFQRIGVCNES